MVLKAARSMVFSLSYPQVIHIFFALMVAIVSAVVAYRQFRTEKYVDSCMEYVRESNKRSLSLKKMADVETTLSELTDAYDSLLQSHKKLRSRIGMRNLNARRSDDASEVPDATTDPAGFKRAMRLKLGAGKLG